MSTLGILHAPQLGLPGLCPVEEAVTNLAQAGAEERGAVFTKLEVVDFILDLLGYDAEGRLFETRLLEPSFGGGDFLLPSVKRLLASWRSSESPISVRELAPCIRAIELHSATFESTRFKLHILLQVEGVAPEDSDYLTNSWLVNGDYLLTALPHEFDFVVGNPPYLRQELIPDALLRAYRARYKTIYDRADLYIPFIERSLTSLSPTGQLGFICADRWMKNRYGGPLRRMITASYHLKAYVDMVGTDAFHTEVSAYPAIMVIGRGSSGPTRIADRPSLDPKKLKELSSAILGQSDDCTKLSIRQSHIVKSGDEPWILGAGRGFELLRRLEHDFPTLEQVGCKVGIGVATGADNAFIGPYEDLDIEPDRKVPLAMTQDIQSGEVVWRGFAVVNPFGDDGKLVDLMVYPKLRAYLEARRDKIAGRHVAQKASQNWYRTIDRIYPELATSSKLLIPDIKGQSHVVFEAGKLYPHHNLYYVVSDSWNLRALQAVLMSRVTHLFISNYSTTMRGGYLRFQAQYLRRIRLPAWETVSGPLREELASAAEARDIDACNIAAGKLYSLTSDEFSTLATY